jgi:hypothetical protein
VHVTLEGYAAVVLVIAVMGIAVQASLGPRGPRAGRRAPSETPREAA